jgi:hypothetical protein
MLTKSRMAVTIATALCLSFVTVGLGFGADAPARGARYARRYDPRTMESHQGEITKIERVASGRRMFRGVHALLKTDRGDTLSIHLGPEWFIEEQEFALSPGDKVQVRGSRIILAGEPALIVAELTKDGKTLRLRDENGVPAWAGWRRRGR